MAGAETPERALIAYNELGKVLQCCGLEESSEKVSPPATEMIFLGILCNTDKLTLSVTTERLQKILLLVTDWLEKSEASLKKLQSLIGKLNFVAHCVKPSRVFICRLLNWLYSFKNEASLSVPQETEKKT